MIPLALLFPQLSPLRRFPANTLDGWSKPVREPKKFRGFRTPKPTPNPDQIDRFSTIPRPQSLPGHARQPNRKKIGWTQSIRRDRVAGRSQCVADDRRLAAPTNGSARAGGLGFPKRLRKQMGAPKNPAKNTIALNPTCLLRKSIEIRVKFAPWGRLGPPYLGRPLPTPMREAAAAAAAAAGCSRTSSLVLPSWRALRATCKQQLARGWLDSASKGASSIHFVLADPHLPDRSVDRRPQTQQPTKPQANRRDTHVIDLCGGESFAAAASCQIAADQPFAHTPNIPTHHPSHPQLTGKDPWWEW